MIITLNLLKRCGIDDFKLSKSQKNVLKTMKKYLETNQKIESKKKVDNENSEAAAAAVPSPSASTNVQSIKTRTKTNNTNSTESNAHKLIHFMTSNEC
jgi:hypothetical protein